MNGVYPLPHAEISKLRFQDLGFGHLGGHNLLVNVNFLFPKHPMVRVKGAEGVGISTLLRILGGIESPTSGDYLVNDRDLDSFSRTERAAIQLAFGYGFDHGGLLSNVTLLDNLLLPMNYHQLVPAREREGRALAYLRHFEMDRYASLLPAFASAAARKACVLARAFLLSPRILILDEPTQSIHQAGADRLAELIRYHQKNLGLQQVFFATEDASFLKGFECETVEIAHKGLIRR